MESVCKVQHRKERETRFYVKTLNRENHVEEEKLHYNSQVIKITRMCWVSQSWGLFKVLLFVGEPVYLCLTELLI